MSKTDLLLYVLTAASIITALKQYKKAKELESYKDKEKYEVGCKYNCLTGCVSMCCNDCKSECDHKCNEDHKKCGAYFRKRVSNK